MSAKRRVTAMEKLQKRIAELDAEIQQWGRDTDETAALARFPAAAVRTYRGVGRAEEQIEKSKRELANGNLSGAGWHLDQAQAMRFMQRVNVVTLPRIVHAAEEGQKVARGRARGGDTRARELKREAAGDEAKVIAALKSILPEKKRRPSNSELADILSERGHGGKEALRKKMPRLLKLLGK